MRSLFDGLIGGANALHIISERVDQIYTIELQTRWVSCPWGCRHPETKCEHDCYVANSGSPVFTTPVAPCSKCKRRPVDYRWEESQ